MWSKIFKNKSSKSASKKDSTGNDCGGSSSSTHKSKLSKVVNSFTLKRCSKENGCFETNTADSANYEVTTDADPPTSPESPSSIQSDYSTASENIAAEPVNLELEPCPICTRTFVPATLAKHVKICEKMAMKKRKIFDSSRQRREGTDLASFLPKNYGLPASKQEPKTSPKAVQNTNPISPKRQEEVTKQTPIAQRKIVTTNTTTTPPTVQPITSTQSAPTKEREKLRVASKRSLNPPSEQCPYCERCFGIKAYDRHVEWCKEKSRIASIQNNTTLTAAKERLQARTKYRAPCLKTKRQVNREKYSGFTSEDLANSLFDAGNVCGTKAPADDHKMSMSTSLNSSIMSEGTKTSKQIMKLIKQNPDEIPLCSPCKGTKKTIGSLKKQRLSLNTSEKKNSPPEKNSGTKGVKSVKNKKLLNDFDFISISEDKPLNPLEEVPKNPVNIKKLANNINIKQANFEVTGKSCVLHEEEEDINDMNENQISNRTRRLYHSDSEHENSEKETIIAGGDLISCNSSTRGITFDNVSPTSYYKNFDEMPVGPARNFQDFKNQNNDLLLLYPTKEDILDNAETMQLSPNKEEIEISKFVAPIDSGELNSGIDDFNDITNKSDDMESFLEDLNQGLTEWYKSNYTCRENNSQENIIEVERKKSAMFKLTRGKTEIYYNTNESTFSLDFLEQNQNISFEEKNENITIEEENENITIEEEIINLPSPAESFIVEMNRGLSDKYDPFLSAKRQLEELCSPSSPTKQLLSPTTPPAKQRTTSLSSSLSSSSNPRNTLNTVKSNFRRTSSLRAPRKPSARPLYITPTLQRPTIQRGLSDEGPISSKFLKPEEYDEMPVKSVCMNDFATIHHHSPKVVKRDANSNPNRRNLRLNLNKNIEKPNNSSNNPLAKTDSLAVFLKYENESKQQTDSPTDLTEKDLKDKTNILNKQTYQKNPTNVTTPLSDKENIPSIKETLSNIIENKNNFGDNSKNVDRVDQSVKPLISSKIYPIRLEPIPSKPISPPKRSSSNEDAGSINLSSILNFKDDDYIDPKLINDCDNLPMNVSKLSDSDLTSSSTESACTAKIVAEPEGQIQRQQQFQQLHQNSSSNRNSTEKRNLLKRQLRLGKNHFLYDMSPDSDPYSEECDKTISMIESSTKLFDTSLNEPSFDDFDFEEFLSSFEHDEDQFPIFKDCKEFLLNRSFNKRCNNLNDPSVRSPMALNLDGFENDEQKREIFISIETSQNDSSPSPTDPIPILPEIEEIDKNANKLQKSDSDRNSSHDEKQDIFEDIPDVNRNNARNIMKKLEHDLNQNETTITHGIEPINNIYPVDSDEISSVEYYAVPRTTKSKQSSDSAYGSLSRHSPIDQRSLRRTSSRTRQQNATSIPEQQPSSKSKYLQKSDCKQQRNRDLSSASSSGSDTSLPPIRPPMMEYLGKDLTQQRTSEPRMSKFCHECGIKFLITHAKFCMECGVRRVVLE